MLGLACINIKTQWVDKKLIKRFPVAGQEAGKGWMGSGVGADILHISLYIVMVCESHEG